MKLKFKKNLNKQNKGIFSKLAWMITEIVLLPLMVVGVTIAYIIILSRNVYQLTSNTIDRLLPKHSPVRSRNIQFQNQMRSEDGRTLRIILELSNFGKYERENDALSDGEIWVLNSLSPQDTELLSTSNISSILQLLDGTKLDNHLLALKALSNIANRKVERKVLDFRLHNCTNKELQQATDACIMKIQKLLGGSEQKELLIPAGSSDQESLLLRPQITDIVSNEALLQTVEILPDDKVYDNPKPRLH